MDPLLVLASSDVESLSFLQSMPKSLPIAHMEQTLTLNAVDGSKFQTISASFNQEMGESFKDLVVVDSDNENVDLNRFYFLVSSENHHSTVSGECDPPYEPPIKAALKDEPHISVVCKSNEENNPDSKVLEIDLFANESLQYAVESKLKADPNTLTESSVESNNVLTESENESIEDRLAKRNALLPKKAPRKKFNGITCDKCKKVFTSSSQYYSHRNVHLQKEKGKKMWWCGQCGSEFKTIKDLKSHEIKEHGEIKFYPCPHCVHSFSKHRLLDSHIRNVHHGERNYKCKLCNQKFFQLYDLKMHLNIHFNINHVCHVCGQQFSHSSNLIRHFRVHTNVKPYSCNICGSRFSQMPSLAAHQVSHTSGGFCSDCTAKFRSIAGLRYHMNNTHKKKISSKELKQCFYKNSQPPISRLYSCAACPERFRFKKGLKIHEKSAHFNKSISCKNCCKVFQNIADFKVHPCIKKKKLNLKATKQSEPSTSKYEYTKCLKCMKYFEETGLHTCKLELETNTLKSEMKELEHISIVKEETCEDTLVMYINVDDGPPSPISCLANNNGSRSLFSFINSDRNKLSISEENIKKEVNEFSSGSTQPFNEIEHTNIKQKLLKRNKLVTRLQTKHLNMQTKTKSKENKNCEKTLDNLFKCSYCSKLFSKKWNWRQHIGTHEASLRRYICVECTRSFSYKSTYTNHLKLHMTEESKQMYNCSQCSKRYHTRSALYQHKKRIHEKECNFMCSVCNRGFYSKSEHTYHMRIHKKEFPFVCFACGRAFAHLSHLYRHERMHTGERPHKCPHCPKTFIQAVTLRIHLKKHAGVQNAFPQVKEELEEEEGEEGEEEEEDEEEDNREKDPNLASVSDVKIEGECKEMPTINLEEFSSSITHHCLPEFLKSRELMEYSIDIND